MIILKQNHFQLVFHVYSLKIKKLFLFFIYVTAFTSCSDNYFNFDEVEHYRKEVTDEELYHLCQVAEKSDQPILLLEILINDYPKKIENTFGDDLLKYGFQKTSLNKSVYNEINSLFSEELSFFNSQTKCAPIYRDIILFKKNQEIVGIAKICFDCELSYIIGTKKNVDNFGRNGGFKALEKLLD